MIVLNLDPNWTGTVYGSGNRKIFTFPGGEVHVKLLCPESGVDKVVLIRHRINNSENLMELILAAEAAHSFYEGAEINAFIPYLPYARQDRRMVKGEPFSIKVLADILAIGKFNKILTLDPHSDVSPALIPNLVPQEPDYLEYLPDRIKTEFGTDFILVSPDGGALKKIYKEAKLLNYKGPILCGNKIRDVRNGNIIRTTLDTSALSSPEELKGRTTLIVDDICDGGRTFIELAKVLREHGAKKVILAVSHGIFSKGEDVLKEQIDRVYTTDSINSTQTDYITRFEVLL